MSRHNNDEYDNPFAQPKRNEDGVSRGGTNSGGKNWPSFYPIIHHDIKNDIPLHRQKVLYVAFTTFLGMVLCLLWNVAAVCAAGVRGSGFEIILASVGCFIVGVPGAYFGWYRPLYRALRTDNSLKFGVFFLVYLIHIVFCVYTTVSPPIILSGKYLTGILPALTLLTSNEPIGILYLIGFGLFCVESLLSIFVIQQVFMHFRGKKAAEAKREAV